MAKSLAAHTRFSNGDCLGKIESKCFVAQINFRVERGSADTFVCADEFNILSDACISAPTLCVRGR